jgi:hypothetical protein
MIQVHMLVCENSGTALLLVRAEKKADEGKCQLRLGKQTLNILPSCSETRKQRTEFVH